MPDIGYKNDPKIRFSSRVENYVRYRPKYPIKIIEYLKNENVLKKDTIIADIGCGTGILTEIFLKNGNQVYGIEPNDDMRRAADNSLQIYPDFVSIKGSAEETHLEADSIDLITAGQAFHWFQLDLTHQEFKRILRPEGIVVLVWNNRKKKGSDFSLDYEEFITKFGTDYKEVRKNEENVDSFFNYKKTIFPNYQDLDYEGFKGRLLSTSYIPLKGPNFSSMIQDLKHLFEKYQTDGFIRIDYDTEVYYGKLN